jgi:hypothetical protein
VLFLDFALPLFLPKTDSKEEKEEKKKNTKTIISG